MAGASGVSNFGWIASVNREKEIEPLRTAGPEFHRRIPTTIPAGQTILTPANIASDLILTATTPNALTGPTSVAMVQYFQSITNPSQVGSGAAPILYERFQQIYQNTDPVNPKVVTFPSGFVPGSITIPPSTIFIVSWELTQLSPPIWTIFSQQATQGGLIPPSGLTSFNGRVAPAVIPTAGDYNTSQITNVSTVPGAFDTDALNNLLIDIAALNGTGIGGPFTQKVNYLVTPALPAAQDLLVNIGGANDYHPSGLTLPGRIGALSVNESNGTAQTALGFSVEATAAGASPANGIYDATATANVTGAGYALYRADSSPAALFGQTPAQAQTNFRSIMHAGLPGAIGDNGAYSFETDVGGTKNSFVNALGWIGFTPDPAAGTSGAVLAAPGFGVSILSLTASTRNLKYDIKSAEDHETSWINRVPIRMFKWISEKEHEAKIPRIGAIVDEVEQAGAPVGAFWHETRNIMKNGEYVRGEADPERPRDINDRSFLFALIAEFQKLRADFDALKSSLSPVAADAKPVLSTKKSAKDI